MKYGEFDVHDVECPLFDGVYGTGVKCGGAGMSGWTYIAEADNLHELMKFVRAYCDCQYDLCPIFCKERARLRALFEDRDEEED